MPSPLRRLARAGTAGGALLAAACSDSLVPQVGGGPAVEIPVEPVAAVAYSPVPRPAIVMLQEGDDPVLDAARALLAEHAPAAGARADSVVPLAYSRGFVAPLTEGEVATIADDPRVAYAENDKPVELSQSTPWALDRMNQRALPLDARGTVSGDGTGVRIYVLDTGVYPGHTDFGGRVSSGPDYVSGTAVTTGDCHGHGTLVASDAAGATMGVARRASIVAVRVMGCAGTGSSTWMIQGIDWVIARKVASPSTPMIINMSLGISGGFSPVDDAVARATQAGITVVVAAGNANSSACSVSPARAPSAITVGATDRSDNRASFSNYGSCVDLYAPGVSVDGAIAGTASGYGSWSGTSAASPYTAGVAALYLQQFPNATPAQVAQALAATATPSVVRGTNISYNLLAFSGLTLPDAPAPSSGGTATPGAPSPPTAASAIACVRRACSFDGRASANGAAAWSWSFGDGATASGATATHMYRSNGKFPVTLTVANAAGITATRLDTATIADGKPRAAFTAWCTGWVCTLDAKGSTDDGRITSYAWSFGDGRSSTSYAPLMRKPYTSVSTFQVRLVVTDDAGQSDTTTVPVTTQPRPPTPAATVTCTTARLCTFDASGSRDDRAISTYTWSFPDNTLRTGVRVTKQYSAAGTYQFRLTVRSTSGLQTSLDGRITIP